MVCAIVNPPPPLSETSAGKGADVSMVALEQSIRGQGRVFVKANDFTTTIAAGGRSALTNLTNILYSKIKIIGISVSSEADTNWRFKFYSKDTGVVTDYATNTFIGDIEVINPSVNAAAAPSYEAGVESNLYYWDQDGTNEIHFIAENTGSVTSKVLVRILYAEAD